jgi:hypothetical protein
VPSLLTVTLSPEQLPLTLSPEMTSQYVPSERQVYKVDENDLKNKM